VSRPAPGSDITVTLACNNRCAFCPRSTLRHVSLDSPADLASRLDTLRSRSDRVVLTGGEVTLLPEAPDLVALCRRRGFRQVGLITNGRRLSDRRLAQRLVEAGLTEVCVTVYDLRPEVHDALTGVPGSLAETLAGLDNLLALARTRGSPSIRVATVACTANLDGLQATIAALSGRGVYRFLVADAILGPGHDEPAARPDLRRVAERVATDPRVPPRAVVWRGFPPCTWGDSSPVRGELHHIETADADPGRLGAYLSAFRGHFVQPEPCDSCALNEACPGVQRLALERFGVGDLVPLPAGRPGERTTSELADFDTWRDPGRLAVTPTLACQMRCVYCGVQLGGAHASPEVLDRSVDLLLTSRRDRLELQFFGGEPLLRWREVERTMDRATGLAEERGKQIRYTLTTNGLLLTPDVLERAADHELRVLFSIDGDPRQMAAQRPLVSVNPDAYRTVEANLAHLVRSGVPYFANLVARPEDVGGLAARVRYLADLGVETLQICYATGPEWPPPAVRAFCEALRECAAFAEQLSGDGRRLRIQNLTSGAEPTLLSNDLLVDVDGTLYGDAALFAERALPGLRDAYRMGSVFELTRFDGLRRSRERNLAILRETYPEGSEVRERVEQHLELGRAVQHTVDGLSRRRTTRPTGRRPAKDRNPLRRRFVDASLREQVHWMERRPDVFRLPLLALQNPCVHDCLFCKQKELEVTDTADVEAWLSGNQALGCERLGLVGNEPLAHPDIDRIVRAAGEHGFSRIEALTSAVPLTADGAIERWIGAGVRGFAIPLFAAEPEIHDGIVGASGSFHGTLDVLARLRDLGANLHVHANVLRQNLAHLDELERRVVGDLGIPLSLIPVRPKRANLPYRDLVPRYREMVDHLHVRSLVAFPRCVAAEIQGDETPDAARISDLLKVYVLDQPFLKPPKCRRCGWRSRCTGTFAAYLALYGDGELRPRGGGE